MVFMLSFTVQFFLWPLLIHYFANLNFIAIPANVLLSPLVELLTVIYFLFISFFSFQFNFLADLTKNLIYFVSNIFFYLLDLFDKIPAKAIEINQHKSLIISSLLFIHLLFIFLIYYDKSSFHNKNKYRIFCKWQNWSKG